jgi:hypothetical protein
MCKIIIRGIIVQIFQVMIIFIVGVMNITSNKYNEKKNSKEKDDAFLNGWKEIDRRDLFE